MLVNKLSTCVPLTHTCIVQLQHYIVLPPEVLSAEIKIAQSRQNETEQEREEQLKRQSKIKSDAHPWLTHASWEMPGENSHT